MPESPHIPPEVASRLVTFGPAGELGQFVLLTPAEATEFFAAQQVRINAMDAPHRRRAHERLAVPMAALRMASAFARHASDTGTPKGSRKDVAAPRVDDAADGEHRVSTATAAAQLRVTPRRVVQLLDAGVLTGAKVSPRLWLVDIASVEAYVARRAS